MLFLQYELLFSVHDEHDPAIMVVQKLIETYPKVDAKLFIGETGSNALVNYSGLYVNAGFMGQLSDEISPKIII